MYYIKFINYILFKKNANNLVLYSSQRYKNNVEYVLQKNKKA